MRWDYADYLFSSPIIRLLFDSNLNDIGSNTGFPFLFKCKRNHRDGDLRDKLDQRLSPERRYSPGRDSRHGRIVRGYSPLRSINKKSLCLSGRNHKKERVDGQSDFSENLTFSNEIEDLVIEGRNISPTPKSILEDQLKKVCLDVNMLTDDKHELEIFVEEKVQEADTLTSQIEELDSQLEKEKEECKRITSRIKKFVKAYNRCSQIEDELERSQARLQKLGEQLGLNISGTSGDEENSNINIVSDGETNGAHMSYPQNERRGNSSPSKKRLCPNQDITEMPIRYGKGCKMETIRMGKRSRWSEHPTQSNIDKENGSLNNGNSSAVHLPSNEKLRKGKKVSVSTSTADKLKSAHAGVSLPSTSMAAHAVDDDEVLEIEEEENVEVSGLPFLLPLPPPIIPNGYSQYEGNDQNIDIDIDGPEEEMAHVDIL
ncbi:zinc finger CCCH domain-containing protein 40 isoform X2 [Durio zibethinus]|uniref:Zinc finger CCCH domain-containing protein 40 isoform X2 n=1 Tax=Durio zibethinus TaxID=66656 RepID=A0A6P5YR74_DURZI|nr:zinc finger CCCH domain-containing protein 40 isoform X2 [Durio zibethinus]XP_022743006.1 zinc finger CCCH domain-containing protein 40 isoform X2 [Durio zibethinus]XP_022743014.1 zinc finger CCCH domain-containing protein 40 isoform X2 [Durio zibethinus]